MLNFFKTAAHCETMETDPAVIIKEHARRKWMVIIGATIGYGMFYVARLSFNIVKKPLVDEGILTNEDLGYIGSALFFSYAFGKFTNGFLSDRANIKRFMSFGLLISAIINLSLGFTTSAVVFATLWGVNGWFQSMGAAPAVVALTNWVPSKSRGTVYGIWSLSHNLGDGLTSIFTALLVASLGWQAGFYGAGIACIIGAIFLYFMLSDKPETYGLPPVDADIKKEVQEHSGEEVHVDKKSIGKQQLSIALNPLIWLLGICSALMYVSRYSVKSWAFYYLQEVKSYSIEEAGMVLGIGAVFGIAGSAASGIISDFFFNSRRGVTTVCYSFLQVLGMYFIFFSPAGTPWMVRTGVGLFEFGTGGLVVLLGGLVAVDIAGKKAAGAAMGIIGIFSYIGAGCQDIISGRLIEKKEMIIDGATQTINDFGNVVYFWVGAGILSLVLTAIFFFLLGRKKKKEQLAAA